MEAIIEKQPISSVETSPVAEASIVPATSVETSIENITKTAAQILPAEEASAIATLVKNEPVSSMRTLGYMSMANLEEGRVLTTGEFAAALAGQKAQGVNIDDLPLAV